MRTLTIRPATSSADLDAVRALCWEYRDHLFQMNPTERIVVETFYPTEKYTALMDQLPRVQARPKGEIVLAELDGGAVGCAMRHEIAPDVAEIKRLYVQDAARGHGAGRALCQAMIDDARAAGYTTMMLDTSVSLLTARRMYERMGFVERDAFYEVPEIAVGTVCFYELPL